MRTTIVSLFLFAALATGAPGGSYLGTWTSDSGSNTGKLAVTVSDSGEGNLMITYQDQPVKPAKVTAKIGATDVEFVFDLDLDGLKIKATFKGAVEGKNIAGKYESKGEDGSQLDSGTWKVTLQ